MEIWKVNQLAKWASDILFFLQITCFITTIIFGVDAFFNIQIYRGKETPSAAPPAVPT
jgi:hypothetical protein